MVRKCVLSPGADWLGVLFTAKTMQNCSEAAKMHGKCKTTQIDPVMHELCTVQTKIVMN